MVKFFFMKHYVLLIVIFVSFSLLAQWLNSTNLPFFNVVWTVCFPCFVENNGKPKGVLTYLLLCLFQCSLKKMWFTERTDCLTITTNADVTTVLGSIPASSDTSRIWGAADEAVLNVVTKKYFEKSLFNILSLCRWFRFAQLAKGKKSRP